MKINFNNALFEEIFKRPHILKPTSIGLFYYFENSWIAFGKPKSFPIDVQFCMEIMNISSYSLFYDYFQNLIDFGAIEIVERGKNRFSPLLISIKIY